MNSNRCSVVMKQGNGREFDKYAGVSEMPESVKKEFWVYVDALNKKLDEYQRAAMKKNAPEQLDGTCADFINFLKTIPDIANARLYQKQKKCAWEIAQHYRELGRKEPSGLLAVLGKNFATKYR